MNLPKRYDSKTSERKWQRYWEDEGIYAFDPTSNKPVYAIDTPPPTVSGKMHLGHAFSFSQMDFVARYKRMKGHNLFYPFGTDDNGLATERLVERKNSVNSKKMDRQDFIDLCLETLEKIRPEFVQDWKDIGMSCDFSVFYSTINEHSRRISQRSFIDLYEKDRIKKEFAPIIFCPKCQTAIAQVEMEDKEKKSELHYIKAAVEKDTYVLFATTRPELIYGCVGMSIDAAGDYVKIKRGDEYWITSKESLEYLKEHFKFTVEEEFQGVDLVGRVAELPLSKHTVSISSDDAVEAEYGTGIVYFCTYGGTEDIEWLTRHDAEPRHVMGSDGKYTEGMIKGMKSKEARETILEKLDENRDLILRKSISQTVNVHERCDTDIEYVATEQWFIQVLDLKDKLLELGEMMQWHPQFMKTRYDNWTKGLKWDWCISRQRHFGVPIPVWYCDECSKVLLPKKADLPVDPLKDKPPKCSCGSTSYSPEKDVLDTWATSSMTPHLAAELYKDHDIYDDLLPMDLRPQAHDIITFWLFNTVIKEYLHDNRTPWEHIMISGWALDPKGKKMSKSKGNVVHPQEMTQKYSADALRFWAAGSKLGEDLAFQEKDLVTGKKTITKLWNASKFALMHLEDFSYEKHELRPMDRWLMTKLQKLISQATDAFEQFEYSKVKHETDKFFWQIFCDNYLEIAKDRLYNPDEYEAGARASAQFTLYEAVLNVLKLFAPFMPHITEEIYQLYFSGKEHESSIHVSTWPTYAESYIDEKAEAAGDHIVDIIAEVRKFKSEHSVSLKTEVSQLTIQCSEKTRRLIELMLRDLKAVTNAQKIVFGSAQRKVNDHIKVTIALESQ